MATNKDREWRCLLDSMEMGVTRDLDAVREGKLEALLFERTGGDIETAVAAVENLDGFLELKMGSLKEDDPQHPSMAAISYEQLLEVELLAKVTFGWRYPWMSMRDVVQLVVIPRQDVKNHRSYALTKNPRGLKVGTFITHCWDEYFADFVDSIRDAFKHFTPKPNLWICAFALIQGDHQVTHDQIGDSLDGCPFVNALRCADWFVVVRNAQRDLYSRIWCVCELMYAEQFGFTTANRTMVIGPNKFSHVRRSCREATAYEPGDKKRILATLDKQDGKVEEIDLLVQRYRNHDALENERSNGFQNVIIFLWLIWSFALVLLVVFAYTWSPVLRPDPSPAMATTLDEVLRGHIQNGDIDRMTRYNFDHHDFALTIPTEIGLFTNLVHLRLDSNKFTGLLPTELGLLTRLSRLSLNSNSLSGTLPTELGTLIALAELDLDSNSFTGSIPKDIATMTRLESLHLANNKLTGLIPAELGMMTELTELHLDKNYYLTGAIPTELGGLTNLRFLSLGDNKLNSSIPTEFGRLSRLVSLWLYRCGLTGPIPTELGILTSLSRRLVLQQNKFTGTIPSELGLLTALQDLTLDRNKLTGTIPSEMFQMSNLIYLRLEGNAVTGKAPMDACQTANFTIYCDSVGFSCGGKCIC